ncbi:LuxR C-terminal-related transcriptional regulator [uncultured Williamsia sp.]|uniref:LuxR C-terminal-related transcriptional regulator n=1 Tax=uncultured Williamsia sp. TaxID=259311 RepID=UPI00260889A4|nr:LuxR C-terminal-related transcriptional regulator [uncultured Williamsia sp.]
MTGVHDTTSQRYADARLSGREIEVLRVWAIAPSRCDAARRLSVSEATVATHVSRIRAKYASVGRPATSTCQLLARALQDGLADLRDL